MKKYKANLQNNLKTLMVSRKIKATDITKNTSIGQGTIYKLLSNELSNPTLDTLEELSNFFNLSISQLIGDLPIIQNDSNLSIHSEKDLFNNVNMLREAEYFRQVNPNSFVITIQDDLMNPYYKIGDCVGGVTASIEASSNKNCIIHLRNEITLVRRVAQRENEFILMCTNSNFSADVICLKKTDIRSCSPILWHRSK